MHDATFWSGVIWALALGLAMGNYACSLIHRLPRGRLLFDEKPYCGTCKTPLQTRDLFPVISALLLRHRCRYCGTSYPITYTVTELLVGGLFVLSYVYFDFGEFFVLSVLLGTFLIILAAIEHIEGIIMERIMLCVLVLGMVARTLADGSLYGFLAGGFYGFIIGAIIWRKHIQRVAHIYRLPKPAELMAIGGLCVGANGLPLFLVIYGAFYIILQKLRARTTVAFGVAVLVIMLL